jgi:hypothetical protein
MQELPRKMEVELKHWKIVAPSEVQVLNPRLEMEGGPVGEYRMEYGVTGSIRNNAAVPISAVKLSMVLYDCPTQTTPVVACAAIGQADVEHVIVEVPPGQVATFEDHVYFKNWAPPRGVLSWNVGVTSVRAPIDASDKKTTGDDAAEAFLMLMGAPKDCGK